MLATMLYQFELFVLFIISSYREPKICNPKEKAQGTRIDIERHFTQSCSWNLN